ncbi:hypothetical protein V1517DRAFT_317686 [Lipomyces orientalis]|uniref:Uncharacterized protein n=1 Tax=Lipomyces orientalis TaxID=1233043 RepID=A0ACC3TUG4_9ASCO
MVLLLTLVSESSSTLQSMIRADRVAAAAADQDEDSTEHVGKILKAAVQVVEREKLIYHGNDEGLDIVGLDESSGDSSQDEIGTVGVGPDLDDAMTTRYRNDSEVEMLDEDIDDLPEMADDVAAEVSGTKNILLTEYDMDGDDSRETNMDSDNDMEEGDDEEEEQEEEYDERFELSSSPSIQDESDIDLSLVYALHTFKATQNGHADAVKGDAMVLLDDSNEYWWLVKMIKDSTIGYLPAEKIETPSERLARLNKHRNIDIVANDIPATRTSSEKSRNPLRRFRSKKTTSVAPPTTSSKTVSFTAPTFYDPPEGYYISDGEGEMGDEDNETDEDNEQDQRYADIEATQDVAAASRDVEQASEEIEETPEITAIDNFDTGNEALDADTTLRDDMDVDKTSTYADSHIDVSADPYIADAETESLDSEDEAEVHEENTTTFLDAPSGPLGVLSSPVVERTADEERVGSGAVEPVVLHAASIPRSKDTTQLSAIAFEYSEKPGTGSMSAWPPAPHDAPCPSSYKTQRHVFQHPLTSSHVSGRIYKPAEMSLPDDETLHSSSTPITSSPQSALLTTAGPIELDSVPDTHESKWSAMSHNKLRRKEPNALLNTKSSLDKLSLRYRLNGGNGVLGNFFKKKASQSSSSLVSSASNTTIPAGPSRSSEEMSVHSRNTSVSPVSVSTVEGEYNNEVLNRAKEGADVRKEEEIDLQSSFDPIFARRSRARTYNSIYSDSSTAIMQAFAEYDGQEPETESIDDRGHSSIDYTADARDDSQLQDNTLTIDATQDDTFYSATNLLASYGGDNISDDGASTIGSTCSSGAQDSSSQSSPPQERTASFEQHTDGPDNDDDDDDDDDDGHVHEHVSRDEDLVSLMMQAARRTEFVHPALASSFQDVTSVVERAATKLDALLFQWWDARRELVAPSL